MGLPGPWRLRLDYSSAMPVSVHLTATLLTPCCGWPLHRANESWPQKPEGWGLRCRACAKSYPALGDRYVESHCRFDPTGLNELFDSGPEDFEDWLVSCETFDPLLASVRASFLTDEFRRMGLSLTPGERVSRVIALDSTLPLAWLPEPN